MLVSWGKFVAENGYQFTQRVTPDIVCGEEMTVHAHMRAWHEASIARLKVFNILNQTFRCNVCSHETVFHAVTKLTALMVSRDASLIIINKD